MLSCDVLSCDDACAGDNSSTASTEPFGGARRAEVDPNKLAPRFSAPSGRAPFAQAGTVRAAGADSESAGLIAKKRSRSLGDSGPVSGRVGAADLTCGKCGREVTICLRLSASACVLVPCSMHFIGKPRGGVGRQCFAAEFFCPGVRQKM